MKKQLLTLAAACLSLLASAVSVPYSSDMGSGGILLSDWTNLNGTSRAQSWGGDRDTSFPCATTGTNGGACKPYDSDRAANCMLVSPELSLKAGTEYTISFWMKTRDNDSENFAIYMGTEKTLAGMKGGTKLLDKPNYKHAADFEKFELTFTPTETADYYFGIYCYSDANSYALYATGFSIAGGEGGGDDPEPDPEPEPDGLTVPCDLTFTSADEFNAWSTFKGSNTSSGEKWHYRDYNKQVWLEDVEGPEDHYLVSPAITFEAGGYAAKVEATVYGKLEVGLMSDPTDVTTFVPFGSQEGSDFNITFELGFDVAEAGDYHIALHACAESGSSMGYRVTSVKLRSDNPVPALVTDLLAAADGMDGLEVMLSWTMPAVNNHGGAMDGNLDWQLLRNGQQVAEGTAAAGEFKAMVDEVPAASAYKYAVTVSNATGKIDAEPKTVSAGFVGRPEAKLDENGLYKFTTECKTADDMDSKVAEAETYTVEDANADGNTFSFKTDSYYWSTCFTLNRENYTDEADDYICSPYFVLQPGYYRVSAGIKARLNSFELGYATNRHDIAGTFTPMVERTDVQEYGAHDYDFILVVAEAGDYAIAIHGFGSASGSYGDFDISSFSIAAIDRAPKAAEGVVAVENGDGTVTLHWANPTHDNAGIEIADDDTLTAEIYRNDVLIATVEEQQPGQPGTFTDVEKDGAEHKYMVIVHLNGVKAEAEAEPTYIYVGEAAELPVEFSDFSSWSFVDEDGTAQWTVSDEGQMKWYRYYGSENDYALSPFFNLAEGKVYELRFTTTNLDGYDKCKLNLVSGRSTDVSNHQVLKEFVTPNNTTEPMTHVIRFYTTLSLPSATANRVDELDADEDEDEEEIPDVICIAPGKQRIGFVPTTCGDLTMHSLSLVDTGISSITDIDTDSAAAEADGEERYFNLQGVSVQKPSAGVYIRVAGGKASKVIVR